MERFAETVATIRSHTLHDYRMRIQRWTRRNPNYDGGWSSDLVIGVLNYAVLSLILTCRYAILSDHAFFSFPRSRSVFEGTTTEFDRSRSTDRRILGTENVRAIVSLDHDSLFEKGSFPGRIEKALESALTEPIGLWRSEL